MKTIDIEAFLTWAYRDELPKAETRGAVVAGLGASSGGWDAISRQGELMAEMVSDGRLNRYGVMPLPIDCGPPHPDALTLHEAVAQLAGMDLDVPDDWSPLEGLGLSPDEQADAIGRAMPRIASIEGERTRLRFKPAELVRRYAILRSAPSWEFATPKARYVSAHGRPLWFRKVPVEIRGLVYEQEADGYNERAKRPFPTAYRKTVLDPDPALAVIDRAEYEVWHDSLALLVELLGESLHDHRLLPCPRPARPWQNRV